MQFNEILKATRHKRGFTAQYMSEHLGISLRAYRFYESGAREPSIKTLIQLADILNVTIDFLVGHQLP